MSEAQRIQVVIEKAMREILGESSTQAVYYHLKKRGINTERVGEDLGSFENAMADLFLDGWKIIKNEINEALAKETGIGKDLFSTARPHSDTTSLESVLAFIANKGGGFVHGKGPFHFPGAGSLM